jgi:predicted small lipoprotein YifL
MLVRTRLDKRLRAGLVLAVLGLAAFSLAACGRAGPPELPPGPVFSSYPPPVAAAPAAPLGPPGSNEDIREKQYEKAAQNGFDRNGNPVAPASERKSFILDFLLQ